MVVKVSLFSLLENFSTRSLNHEYLFLVLIFDLCFT